jgi:phage terminase large subunit-like protein
MFSPAIQTLPLSDDFKSEGDWLLPIVRLAWRSADDPEFELDEWQSELIRRILEIYPDDHERAGQLRFRQVVVSMGRQNGKSVIGAILGLYGLLRAPGQSVIGIASSAEQARILYDRTMLVIRRNKSLADRFAKLTDTRGIRAHDGGKYEIKAAKSSALQGIPINVGLADELHIMPGALWSDMVNGTSSKSNGIVIGITTAGDENSELLKQLYEVGMKAAGGDPQFERFGFFVWEAPDARVPDDDEELSEYLKAANPALQAGRIDMSTVLSDVRAMPPSDVIRYRLNRFVAAQSQFITPLMWQKCARPYGETIVLDGARPIFAIDRTPDWGHAVIAVAIKNQQGQTETELVASIVKPNLEQLVSICTELMKHSPQTFIVDGYGLKDLATELRRRGMPVAIATQGDVIGASALTYSKIAREEIRHSSDPLLSIQFPRTVRKNIGDQFRISRKDSSVEIDGVMATLLAIYGAETRIEQSLQVF